MSSTDVAYLVASLRIFLIATCMMPLPGNSSAQPSGRSDVRERASTQFVKAANNVCDRLWGHVTELGGETKKAEKIGDWIRDLNELTNEAHYRFPPDCFHPGRLDNPWADWGAVDLRGALEGLSPEELALLEAFRALERDASSAASTLSAARGRLGEWQSQGLDVEEQLAQPYEESKAILASCYAQLDGALTGWNAQIPNQIANLAASENDGQPAKEGIP
jgi:hypothetical protein